MTTSRRHAYRPTPEGTLVALSSARVARIPTTAWEELSRRVDKEEALLPHSSWVLRSRWERGEAAIAVGEPDDEIISYASVIPLLTPRLEEELRRDTGLSELPFELFESSTGWTNRRLRGRGINLGLRQELYRSSVSRGEHSLGLAVAVGLASSPILQRLGWRIIPFDALPFSSRLVGWPDRNDLFRPELGHTIQMGRDLYYGNHVPLERSREHDWEQYVHLWSSNPTLQRNIESFLSDAYNGCLARWCDAMRRSFEGSSD